MTFPGDIPFTEPPRDGTITLLDAIDFNGAHNSTRALFRYLEPDTQQVVDITWREATIGIHNAGRLVTEAVGPAASQVVAVISTADSITNYTVMAGIMRAGYVVFPLSNRNSPAAMAHLLLKANARFLVASEDTVSQDTIARTFEILRESSAEPPSLVPLPSFVELYSSSNKDLLPKMGHVKLDTPGMILHTSGSTSFPKPITLTMRAMMSVGLGTYFGELNMSKHVSSGHALPMFHLTGAIHIAVTVVCGMTMGMFPPTIPAVIPTPDRVWDDVIKSQCTTIIIVPMFVETWFRDPVRRKAMRQFKMLAFTGGPLIPSIGDALVAEGVKLAPIYGMTEAGSISTLFPSGPAKEGWAYWSVAPHMDPVLVPFDENEGTYKLLLKKCATHTPSVLNTTIDGVAALDTNDLFLRHPDNPKLIKVYGRADDQIIHSTGEKTSPIPIEGIICAHPQIESALMFGTGKFHAGILIAPHPQYLFDPADTSKLAEFRNHIWEIVSKANEFAPSHSRILKEMIICIHPDKPFEYTAKRTPQRNKVLAAYKVDIDAAYAAFDHSAQTHLAAPAEWNQEQTIAFVRRVISAVGLRMELGDNDDIFQRGCDSLQATYIRNTILHVIKTSFETDIRTFPQNFVYDNPTIQLLSNFLLRSCVAETGSPREERGDHTTTTRLTEKYSRQFPTRQSSSHGLASLVRHWQQHLHGGHKDEVMLITGTTGGLGSYLLAEALLQPSVVKVYALNRPGKISAQTRQAVAFKDKDLNLSLLDSSKLVLLEGDTTLDNLGLSLELYDELRTGVTTVIHNAWIVNFNLSVTSMEPMLLSTRHLVDFALTSKRKSLPKFVFTSSIGVFRNWYVTNPGRPAPEEEILHPAISANQGYSESKWCAEEVITAASKACASFKPVIVRVGQLCGARASGTWNTNEWVPSIVKSSLYLGSLPKLPGDIDWVPVDIAAKVIIEVRTSKDRFLNLVHPNPVVGEAVFNQLGAMLGLPLVEFNEWVDALESSGNDTKDHEVLNKNPALKVLGFMKELLLFYGSRHLQNGQAVGLRMDVETSLARRASPSLEALREQRSIEADAEKWIAYWQKVGYI